VFLTACIDVLARLSVYTVSPLVPSSSYTSLVPHFLQPQTALLHTIVVIMLDWTQPWTFSRSCTLGLLGLKVGSRVMVHVNSKSSANCEEHVHFILFLVYLVLTSPRAGQAHLQHYTEPSAEPLPATSCALQGTTLSLGPGAFTHNTAGVPIIVVCTKADLIDDNTDHAGDGASGM